MTDEWTPLPTQIGMLYAYPSKVLYNMFYDPNDYILYEKVLTDLRYGIRTGYHAIDDAPVQYGVDFKAPDQIPQVNRLVEAARLLNRFDPGKPDANVLVVFGTEALCNWFPDTAQRTAYDVRKLAIEEKAVELQQAGYLTALVPTDLITDGRLTLSRSNRPVLDGHEFDAMIFLYPEYSRPGTMELMERYMAGGGKLMIEGEMNYDFDGNYVKDRFGAWKKKAVATEFSVEDMPKLGVRKNVARRGLAQQRRLDRADRLSFVVQRRACGLLGGGGARRLQRRVYRYAGLPARARRGGETGLDRTQEPAQERQGAARVRRSGETLWRGGRRRVPPDGRRSRWCQARACGQPAVLNAVCPGISRGRDRN